ncbi:hypothetical protein [Marisediminicola senii]|uniref:hypothetical protein n=1 Tax=Marisediminicola senii TaxID=2711233 RepID=UPI001F2608AF|nr:hypothetical protein [Marisediminicola senii]
MNPLLFVLFGLIAGGVLVLIARDRGKADGRARSVAAGGAGLVLLLTVLIFSGVFSGDSAQVIVTTVYLLLVAVMFGATWVTYRGVSRN